MNIKAWIEAMRLRTLPVSVAGVISGSALSILSGYTVRWLPGALCLLFAILCQIASNFANEYYDYRDGLDRPGREGPRRGVTEGDIQPHSMLVATIITLATACITGLSLTYWGGWELILVGIVIATGVFAYSAGPYPLSRHALGEIAVIFFFGIIPVNFTYSLMTGHNPATDVILSSVSIGLMGANVLIVNNYRDRDDDRAVGKITIAVKFGRVTVQNLYLFSGFIAVALMTPIWGKLPVWGWCFPTLYLIVHTTLYFQLIHKHGHRLNPLLGLTAISMLVYAISLLASALFWTH